MLAERVQTALSRIDMDRPYIPSEHGLRVGLLGRGISASLTPIMHEAEGKRLGLPYRYDLIDFDTLELDDADLAGVLHQVRDAGFRGCNVTYPFKTAILPHLSSLSPEAQAIGAVNTVVIRDEQLVGYNTDCSGFARSFEAAFGAPKLQRVVQLGAGGAGAAVAQALAELGVLDLVLVDVDADKAKALAERVARANGVSVSAVHPSDVSGLLADAQGVVNTTPVGMDKLPGLPLPVDLLRPDQFVVDIIYFPRETQFIKAAREKGCRVLSGGGMAVYQAVGAFSLFAERPADPQEMAGTFAQFA